MYEVAKHEFLKWLNTYQTSKELSAYEITLLNIILENFELVASKGTATGARANYLVEKIEKNAYVPSKSSLLLNNTNVVSNSKVEHLKELEIESFRGFSTSLKFDFSKQYSTFYGPNGSGKSSLCEALEFCILGTVQEATTRRIPLDSFLKNKRLNSYKKPKLSALINGQEKEFQSNLETYRFSFIEKNRIDSFSHIGAATPSEKSERLAALFGLSEFSNFVKGFTETLENKIKLDTTQDQLLRKKESENTKNEQFLLEKQKDLNLLEKNIQEQILGLKNPKLKDLEEAINFLQSEDGNGKIKDIEKLSIENKKNIYKIDFFTVFPSAYDKILNDFTLLCSTEEELISLSVNTNMVAIYQAVSNLSNDIDRSVCPVCKTPVSKTVVNPFENAKNELENLRNFTELNQKIREYQKELLVSVKNFNSQISNNNEMLGALGYNVNELFFSIPDSSNDLAKTEMKDNLKTTLAKVKNIKMNIDSNKTKILEINAKAEKYNLNNEYTIEAARLRQVYQGLIEAKGSLKTLKKEINDITNALDSFKTEKDNLEKAVIKENETNTHKQKYNEAYKNIVINLTNYQKQLPLQMSDNLSLKVKDYYNKMNQDDADFEMITELKMPVNSTDCIMIKFQDGIEENALQILSEGHVKLLGLAILLAKAIDTQQSFIILDDIVNAIDDDHRSGVASLIFENEDFKNVQIILTCHSEPFMKRIEDCIPRNERDKKIMRYVFIPPVCEHFRGIVVDYSNPKEPLELASKNLRANELKDAAQKCRQATESMVNKLWKKLSQTYKIQISVALNAPNAKPELSSVVDGLIKQMKSFGQEAISVSSDLSKLKSDFKWFLMNKGTHYEEDQFQFEHSDVRNLYALLVSLEKNISELKIKNLVPLENSV